MAAKTLVEIYELLDTGNPVRMQLPKQDAETFRTRIASYKSKLEKVLRGIDDTFTPKVLSLTYNEEDGIATYQFKELRSRAEPKLFEILD